MEIKFEKLPKSRVKLTVKVSPIQMSEYFNRAFNELSTSLDLPGFRKGKAPAEMARKGIDPTKLSERVLEIALPITYVAAVKEKEIIPLEGPKINVLEFGQSKPLVYEAEVDIMPQVKLADYRRLKTKNQKPKTKITEKEIEEILKRLQKQLSTPKPTKRPSEKGDFIEIDFEAKVDGKPLPEGKSKNHPLIIGEGQFIKEFEQNLEGLKKGQEKTFQVKFPADYFKSELAGKNVEFNVKVIEIKEVILPKIDDELAKKIGKKNLEELKKSIADSKKKETLKKEEERCEREMIDKIVAASNAEIPESLVNVEVTRNYQNFVYQVASRGLKIDDYLKQVKKTPEQILKDLRGPAELGVKTSLVIEAIRKEENINVQEEEVETEIKEFQKKQQEAGQLSDKKAEISDEDREKIKNILGIRKTINRLKKITYKR